MLFINILAPGTTSASLNIVIVCFYFTKECILTTIDHKNCSTIFCMNSCCKNRTFKIIVCYNVFILGTGCYELHCFNQLNALLVSGGVRGGRIRCTCVLPRSGPRLNCSAIQKLCNKV